MINDNEIRKIDLNAEWALLHNYPGHYAMTRQAFFMF